MHSSGGSFSGSFSGGGQDRAAEGVAGHGEAEVGRGGVGRDADGLDVEGVHHDEVAVRAVPGRRGCADEAGRAGVVGQLEAPLGRPEPVSSPEPSGPVLLETFDRMWTASELARRWSAHGNPDRDGAGEHRRLEEAALARDADTAAGVLARHLTLTAAGLTGCSHPEPVKEA